MRGVRTGGGMGVRGGVEVGERRGRRALVHSPRGEAARSRGAGRGGRAPRRARRRSPRGRRRGSRRRRRRPCRLREDGRCGVGGGAGRVRVGARSRGAIDRRREKKRRSFRLSRRDVPLEICARAVVSTALTATERLEATLAPRTDALAPSARGAVIAEAMLGVRARGGWCGCASACVGMTGDLETSSRNSASVASGNTRSDSMAIGGQGRAARIRARLCARTFRWNISPMAISVDKM